MKIFFSITFLFLCLHLNAQEYIKDESFKFKFIKANKARGNTYFYTIKPSKSEKKVQVRFKMKSLSEEKENFDPNKFYLVSDERKIRIRPIDVRHNYAAGWIFISFDYLSNIEVTDKKLKQWITYKPEVENTFNNYKIDGYDDICQSINFGTKRKPRIATPYLDLRELKSCKVDLYFILPKDMKRFKVFYGHTLLSDTSIKK